MLPSISQLTVSSVVPLRKISDEVYRRDKRFFSHVFGTTPEFFKVVNVAAGRGRLLTVEDMIDKCRSQPTMIEKIKRAGQSIGRIELDSEDVDTKGE